MTSVYACIWYKIVDERQLVWEVFSTKTWLDGAFYLYGHGHPFENLIAILELFLLSPD